MSQPEPHEPNIPVLTEVIRSAASIRAQQLDTLLAEVQTALASRTFRLAEELLRSALTGMEATLFQQVSSKLRRELPELIDATLREHFEARSDAEGRS
jgi:hypothetical protein